MQGIGVILPTLIRPSLFCCLAEWYNLVHTVLFNASSFIVSIPKSDLEIVQVMVVQMQQVLLRRRSLRASSRTESSRIMMCLGRSVSICIGSDVVHNYRTMEIGWREFTPAQ